MANMVAINSFIDTVIEHKNESITDEVFMLIGDATVAATKKP